MANFLCFVLLLMIASSMAMELIEPTCWEDSDCSQYERGKCKHNSCVCTAPDSDQMEECKFREESQLFTNIIGGGCPCTQPHSECIDRNGTKQCYCSPGHHPSLDKRRCLPELVKLDGDCELDIQCQESDVFSVCHHIDNKCLCKTSFEPHLGRCLALLDGNCLKDTDCESFGNAICLTKIQKCACSPKYVRNRDVTKCISGALYGKSCDHNLPCQLKLGAAAQCREEDRRCGCRPSHYLGEQLKTKIREPKDVADDNPICQPIVPFGAYCVYDRDCHMRAVENGKLVEQKAMQCMWGECRCTVNSTLVANKCILHNGGGVPQQPIIWIIGITLHGIFIGIYNIFDLTL